MIIRVECIHREKSHLKIIQSLELDKSGTIFDFYNTASESDKITCRIKSDISDEQFRLPKESICINDVIGFSNNMMINEEYDCILEISSFIRVDLNTNHRYSIRGKYWKNVPQKYLPRYYIYKEQECIEIGNDIILISIYSNGFTNKVNDGGIIEIISQGSINLRSVNKHIL